MNVNLKLSVLAGVSALALAACDSDDGNNGQSPPPGSTALEDNFGPGFGPLFRASANTDPAEPPGAAMVAVSATTDPVPVP